jgi:hypothetical protein
MSTWVYRLDYTVWDQGFPTRITGDTVQFDEPMTRNEIITGLYERYVMLRDENVSIGNATIELLSS